jgi:glucuronokinase
MEKSMPGTVRAIHSLMSTGRSFTSRCAARAALAGNPSDGYGGAVVAVPVADLCAMASATESTSFVVQASDPDLARLLDATADGFDAVAGSRPAVRLSASTTIPRSVGLAGSSALVIAALRALAACADHRWEPLALAELALDIERGRLGIEAGLQDRLVQAVGRPVSMTFDPVGYEPLDLPGDLPLFVAWSSSAAETSDTVHRSLRRRYLAGDDAVVTNLAELSYQAHLASLAIRAHDAVELGRAMDRSFDLRYEMMAVDQRQVDLIETGRRAGAAVNSAGSGGSVVGLVRHAHELDTLRAAYERSGASFLALV